MWQYQVFRIVLQSYACDSFCQASPDFEPTHASNLSRIIDGACLAFRYRQFITISEIQFSWGVTETDAIFAWYSQTWAVSMSCIPGNFRAQYPWIRMSRQT